MQAMFDTFPIIPISTHSDTIQIYNQQSCVPNNSNRIILPSQQGRLYYYDVRIYKSDKS